MPPPSSGGPTGTSAAVVQGMCLDTLFNFLWTSEHVGFACVRDCHTPKLGLIHTVAYEDILFHSNGNSAAVRSVGGLGGPSNLGESEENLHVSRAGKKVISTTSDSSMDRRSKILSSGTHVVALTASYVRKEWKKRKQPAFEVPPKGGQHTLSPPTLSPIAPRDQHQQRMPHTDDEELLHSSRGATTTTKKDENIGSAEWESEIWMAWSSGEVTVTVTTKSTGAADPISLETHCVWPTRVNTGETMACSRAVNGSPFISLIATTNTSPTVSRKINQQDFNYGQQQQHSTTGATNYMNDAMPTLLIIGHCLNGTLVIFDAITKEVLHFSRTLDPTRCTLALAALPTFPLESHSNLRAASGAITGRSDNREDVDVIKHANMMTSKLNLSSSSSSSVLLVSMAVTGYQSGRIACYGIFSSSQASSFAEGRQNTSSASAFATTPKILEIQTAHCTPRGGAGHEDGDIMGGNEDDRTPSVLCVTVTSATLKSISSYNGNDRAHEQHRGHVEDDRGDNISPSSWWVWCGWEDGFLSRLGLSWRKCTGKNEKKRNHDFLPTAFAAETGAGEPQASFFFQEDSALFARLHNRYLHKLWVNEENTRVVTCSGDHTIGVFATSSTSSTIVPLSEMQLGPELLVKELFAIPSFSEEGIIISSGSGQDQQQRQCVLVMLSDGRIQWLRLDRLHATCSNTHRGGAAYYNSMHREELYNNNDEEEEEDGEKEMDEEVREKNGEFKNVALLSPRRPGGQEDQSIQELTSSAPPSPPPLAAPVPLPKVVAAAVHHPHPSNDKGSARSRVQNGTGTPQRYYTATPAEGRKLREEGSKTPPPVARKPPFSTSPNLSPKSRRTKSPRTASPSFRSTTAATSVYGDPNTNINNGYNSVTKKNRNNNAHTSNMHGEVASSSSSYLLDGVVNTPPSCEQHQQQAQFDENRWGSQQQQQQQFSPSRPMTMTRKKNTISSSLSMRGGGNPYASDPMLFVDRCLVILQTLASLADGEVTDRRSVEKEEDLGRKFLQDVQRYTEFVIWGGGCGVRGTGTMTALTAPNYNSMSSSGLLFGGPQCVSASDSWLTSNNINNGGTTAAGYSSVSPYTTTATSGSFLSHQKYHHFLIIACMEAEQRRNLITSFFTGALMLIERFVALMPAKGRNYASIDCELFRLQVLEAEQRKSLFLIFSDQHTMFRDFLRSVLLDINSLEEERQLQQKEVRACEAIICHLEQEKSESVLRVEMERFVRASEEEKQHLIQENTTFRLSLADVGRKNAQLYESLSVSELDSMSHEELVDRLVLQQMEVEERSLLHCSFLSSKGDLREDAERKKTLEAKNALSRLQEDFEHLQHILQVAEKNTEVKNDELHEERKQSQQITSRMEEKNKLLQSKESHICFQDEQLAQTLRQLDDKTHEVKKLEHVLKEQEVRIRQGEEFIADQQDILHQMNDQYVGLCKSCELFVDFLDASRLKPQEEHPGQHNIRKKLMNAEFEIAAALRSLGYYRDFVQNMSSSMTNGTSAGTTPVGPAAMTSQSPSSSAVSKHGTLPDQLSPQEDEWKDVSGDQMPMSAGKYSNGAAAKDSIDVRAMTLIDGKRSSKQVSFSGSTPLSSSRDLSPPRPSQQLEEGKKATSSLPVFDIQYTAQVIEGHLLGASRYVQEAASPATSISSRSTANNDGLENDKNKKSKEGSFSAVSSGWFSVDTQNCEAMLRPIRKYLSKKT